MLSVLLYVAYAALMAVTLMAVYAVVATLIENASTGLAPLLVFAAVGTIFLALLVMLPQMVVADLLRDVVHYFAPSPDRQDHPHTRDTKRRLHDLLVELAGGGTRHIVIVAHSLGTVIATEVLRDFANSEGATPVRIDLVTCGSPLKRLLAGLLPRRVPPVRVIFEQMRSHDRWTLGGWINAYRVLDYVGKALGGRRLPMHRPGDIVGALEDDVVDVRLSPWYRPGYSHANYWRDARLLQLLLATLLRPPLADEDRGRRT